MRQLVNQPALGGVLHPGASQRHQLAGEKQPEIAMAQGRERPTPKQVAQDDPAWLTGTLLGHTRHQQRGGRVVVRHYAEA